VSIRAELITLDEIIDAGITLGLPVRVVAKIAREQGYRFDNNEFHKAYRDRKIKREAKVA